MARRTRSDKIRMVKTIQTSTLVNRAALETLLRDFEAIQGHDPNMAERLREVLGASDTYIQALGVIVSLMATR